MRRVAAAIGVLALLLLLTRCAVTQMGQPHFGSQPPAATQPGSVEGGSVPAPSRSRSRPSPRTHPKTTTTAPRTTTTPAVQVADPVRIRVPRIGVNAPTDPLELVNDELPVPKDFSRTGWWSEGPEPGEPGPAVIVGHVDSTAGPAVFFRIRLLVPGDRIYIDRADGTTAVFAVQGLQQVNKDSFPTEQVYGDTPDAQLRLITCGGKFDYTARRYLDNIIAYAKLVR